MCTYSKDIEGEVFLVPGNVDNHRHTSFLHCSVNSLNSRPKHVIVDNSLYLFSID